MDSGRGITDELAGVGVKLLRFAVGVVVVYAGGLLGLALVAVSSGVFSVVTLGLLPDRLYAALGYDGYVGYGAFLCSGGALFGALTALNDRLLPRRPSRLWEAVLPSVAVHLLTAYPAVDAMAGGRGEMWARLAALSVLTAAAPAAGREAVRRWFADNGGVGTGDLPGYERFAFADGGVEKTVYRAGSGPAVVLIHELPGMVPECVDLGRKIAAEGYTVYMPLLFGEPMANYGAKPLLWPCVWKEFSVLSTHGKSPAADWLRALARLAFKERGGKGVGAIGMCFTGRFALSLMMDKELIAPVICQPGASYSDSALGIPEAEWDNAVKRSKDENIPVLGMRFEGDFLCRAARFDTLREGFGERFKEVVLPGKKHSALTLHFKTLSPADQAKVWGKLSGFLSERLKP